MVVFEQEVIDDVENHLSLVLLVQDLKHCQISIWS